MDLVIKSLTPGLAGDYFDFFDHRAFTDHAEWAFCYCTFFHISKEHEKQIEQLIKADGDDAQAHRCALRNAAADFIRDGTLQGYLAYDEGVAIGWCNANDKAAYQCFDYEKDTDAFVSAHESGKAKAAMCFVIAPDYRWKGVATALLDRVCEDAQRDGYDAVEGYPRFHDTMTPFDYNGPARLFEKAGFSEISRQGHVVIMRKELRTS